MMPSLGNKVAGVDRKSKLKDACNVSESERLIAGSRWILNRTVAMGMNCGTGLGAVRLKNLKSKVAAVVAAEDGNKDKNNPCQPVRKTRTCTRHDPYW